jgi:hypothetical protein
MKAIFRYSAPKLREDSLLPNKKAEAQRKLKEATLKAYFLKPFYRFKKGALDLRRRRVAIPDPRNYYPEGGDILDPDDGGLEALSKVSQPYKGDLREKSNIKYHGPPRTPGAIGYGNTRRVSGNVAPAAAVTRKDRFYPINAEKLGEDSETLTWTGLENRVVVDGPESLEIKREYRRRHKSAFDRKNMAKDINQKFVTGVKTKSRFADYYPHDTKPKETTSAFDEFGNRIQKSFNFHTEHFDEIGDPNAPAPPQARQSSRQHLDDSGSSVSTDPFIKHFPSMTDFSSSAPTNLHNSQYLAQENNYFVNDNETHIASRASELSLNSMDSRFHVPVKFQKHRHFRGLSKYRLKSGITLISKKDRGLQLKARDDHRREQKELEEARKFLDSRRLATENP